MLNDALKKQGCHWSDGAGGRSRSWYIDVDKANAAAETEFLRATIGLKDVEPHIQAMNASIRFRGRFVLAALCGKTVRLLGIRYLFTNASCPWRQ